MERDGHPARLREGQRRVDQLGIRPVVLVDLEPDRARLKERLEVGGGHRARARLDPDVQRPLGHRRERPLHRPGRLLEARRDQRRDAGRQRSGHELGADEMDVAVDRARGGDQSVAHDRGGVRPDPEVDPVRDRRVARPAHADDASVLDSDVGLDHADRRIDHDRTGDDDVELGVRRPGGLRHPRPEILRIAPLRLVARCLPILTDPDPQVRVPQPDPIGDGRAVSRQPLRLVHPVAHPAGVASPPEAP